MAQRKAAKGKGKARVKARAARRQSTGARKPAGRKAARKPSVGTAALEGRIATLEAENRRLREELGALRAARSTGEPAASQPQQPALEF